VCFDVWSPIGPYVHSQTSTLRKTRPRFQPTRGLGETFDAHQLLMIAREVSAVDPQVCSTVVAKVCKVRLGHPLFTTATTYGLLVLPTSVKSTEFLQCRLAPRRRLSAERRIQAKDQNTDSASFGRNGGGHAFLGFDGFKRPCTPTT
jgi:hypothetical protein